MYNYVWLWSRGSSRINCSNAASQKEKKPSKSEEYFFRGHTKEHAGKNCLLTLEMMRRKKENLLPPHKNQRERDCELWWYYCCYRLGARLIASIWSRQLFAIRPTSEWLKITNAEKGCFLLIGKFCLIFFSQTYITQIAKRNWAVANVSR